MAREISIKFLGDESDLSRASKNASGDLDHFAKRAGVTAGVVGAATSAAFRAIGSAARAAVGFTKSAIAEGEEAARMGRVTTALIKSTGGVAKVSASHIASYSQSLSNVVGIDDEVIQGAQNVLLTFRDVRNEVGKGNDIFDRATKASADLAAVFGGDLKGKALQLGKALQDPTKGVTKLQRSGINFTDSQKNMIKVLQASGDILGAQKIILGEVERQVGGAAKANSSATARMTVAWKNFQEDVGTAILPAFNAIVDFLVTTVLPGIETFGKKAASATADAFKTVASITAPAFAKVLDLLKEFGAWCRDNADAITVAAAALASFAVSMAAISGVQSGVAAVKNLASSFALLLPLIAANIWVIIPAAIIAIGVGAFIAYKKFKPFHDIVDQVWQALQRVADVVASFTMDALNRAVDVGRGIWDRYGGTVLAVMGTIGAVVSAAVSFLVGLWTQYGDEITGILGGLVALFSAVFALIAQVVSAAWSVVSGVTSVLWAQISVIIKVALAVITAVVSVAVALIRSLWDQFGNDIINTVVRAFTFIRNVIEGALRIIQGIINVFTGLLRGDWGKAWDGIKQIASGAWEIIRAVFQGALDFLRTTWSTVAHLLVAPFKLARDLIGPIVDGIKGVLGATFDAALAGLKAAINGLIEILNGAIKAYNAVPFAPNIPTIPTIHGVPGVPTATPLGAPSATATTATASVLAPVGAATAVSIASPRTMAAGGVTVINLPSGVNGSSVINAVRRHTQRNGTTGWH